MNESFNVRLLGVRKGNSESAKRKKGTEKKKESFVFILISLGCVLGGLGLMLVRCRWKEVDVCCAVFFFLWEKETVRRFRSIGRVPQDMIRMQRKSELSTSWTCPIGICQYALIAMVLVVGSFLVRKIAEVERGELTYRI